MSISRQMNRPARIEELESRLLLTGGGPDTTFGYGLGYISSNFRSGSNDALDVAQQSNGNYVVAGTLGDSGGAKKDAVIINYTGKGKFNPNFGAGGLALINFGNSLDDVATGVGVTSDDKIVACGFTSNGNTTSDIWLAKYTTLGLRDKTFANGVGYERIDWGGVDLAAKIIIEPTTENILVVGSSGNPLTGGGFVVARFDKLGNPDYSFGTSGVFKSNPGAGKADVGSAIYRQSDGKYLVAGARTTFTQQSGITSSGFYIGRLTNTGQFDSTFASGGVVIPFGRNFEFANSISQGPNNTIYAAGVSANGIHEFGTGLPFSASAPAATLSDFAALRVTDKGVLDNTFSGDGKMLVDFGSNRLDGATFMNVQSDGAMVIGGGSGISGGNADFATARLTTSGGLDPLWGTGGMYRWNVGGSNGYLGGRMFKGGKIVGVGHIKLGVGNNRLSVSRYLNTGTFNPY